MNLNLKNVLLMNKEEIFKSLLPTIDQIYKSFEYTKISREDYYSLVVNEIDLSKKSYDGKIPYRDYIKKKINLSLSKIVEKLLSNTDTSYELINNYINKIKRISNYENAIKYFNRVNNFFNHYNYVPDIDILLKLINNNKIFNKMTELVINRHYKEITEGLFENQIDNSLIITSIGAYCVLNNIEIKEVIEEKEIYYDSNYDDDKEDIFDYNNINDVSSVKLYLSEIDKIPLLTKEEEEDLAKKIINGDQDAKKKFYEGNLRLVVFIAKKFINRGLPFMDLIQEGNIGLIKAVEKFDINKGYRFSTYAAPVIRQSIQNAIPQMSRNIRIPRYLYPEVYSCKKAIHELEMKLNRKPTINEIAKKMNISIKKVKTLCELMDDTLSINVVIGEKKNHEIGDIIPDTSKSPEDLVIDNSLVPEIEKVLNYKKLNKREIDVIKLRYGFGIEKPMTLKEIGDIYNISEERARQVTDNALRKIRQSKYASDLISYTKYPNKSAKTLEKLRESYAKVSVKK